MRDALFIDGRWKKPASGATFDVVDPSSEEIIHRAPAASKEDVAAAAAAARRAFDEGPWPRMKGAERAKVLTAIADAIAARREELARLETLDNGKPLPEALWDIDDSAGCFRYYAQLAAELDERRETPVALLDQRFASAVALEPVGVAGAIIPWNYPLLMAAWKVAPALAAGCAMVLKPSELTPLTALELGAIAAEAGLPPGALNIVTGTGAEAGQPLAAHPAIDKIAFTGSLATGRKLMAIAAEDIKRISLELGGKSPFVVFADSDVEDAVEWIMFGVFWNQGQVCSATSRVLIERPIYRRLVDRLVERAREIRMGPGLEEGVKLGPLVSAAQRAKVAAAVSGADAAGARILAGGAPPRERPRGYFYAPTVIAEAPLDSAAWREEIFGPVVCVRPFDEEREAVALANDSRYGLAAAVMSADDERCARVAAAFRAGIVWVNCSQPTFTEAPWGGFKQSGIGRELGRWGLENYLEVKQITRFDRSARWDWYR